MNTLRAICLPQIKKIFTDYNPFNPFNLWLKINITIRKNKFVNSWLSFLFNILFFFKKSVISTFAVLFKIAQ